MRRLLLKVKFRGEEVECAKSPGGCKGCRDQFKCEEIELSYNEFEGIEECMRERSYKRVKGAIRQK